MSNHWPDLFGVTQFLEPSLVDAIVAEFKSAPGSPATVYASTASGTIEQSARRTFRLRPSNEIVALVIQKLFGIKDAVERHFDVVLKDCEEPQFLRYREGDFFVAHQDGNTPLIHDASRFRKVSAVLFLSAFSEDPAPESYGGGALVLHGPYSGPPLSVPLTPEPGTLICFRAETTHEVLPVTHGERFTLVSWYL